MHLCQDTDFMVWFPWMAAALGRAYALRGRAADAVPLLTQAMEWVDKRAMIVSQVVCGLPLSEAQMLAGHLDEAHALAEQVLVLASTRQERGNQTYALRLLGEIATRRDAPENDRAESYYRRAFAQATELRMRPLVAHCHLGLGKLYRRTGDREQASEHLTTATTMYREMDMRFWLEQAEAEMRAFG
jgi:tetratricopeptide (TPR) repeat protein